MPAEPEQTVTVAFKVEFDGGHFTANAVVPSGQTNLTQLLPVIQDFSNSVTGAMASRLGEDGEAISCRKGCAACCRQMVPLTIFEAEALADYIRSLPETRQHELANRFHQALLKLSATGLIDRMVNENWLAETEASRKLTIEYLYLRIPCPFLEDEACSIHDIRPFGCREYLVTSPPEHCFDPSTLPVAPVRLPVSPFLALQRIGAKVEHDARGWIPLLFLFAWMKSGAHPGEAVTGEGPQVLYEFVRHLAPDAHENDAPSV